MKESMKSRVEKAHFASGALGWGPCGVVDRNDTVSLTLR